MNWNDAPHLGKQGLFIVGHARSGTSILLHALNSSPEIYLLGEPSLYRSGTTAHFSDWYNSMHVGFGNPRSKSTYCPRPPSANANGVSTLDWLSKRYRYVGEKLAFRSTRLGYNTKAFFDFHATHFFDSYYICIMRHPSAVLASNLRMFQPEQAAIYAESYIHILVLISELYATFPNVLVLSHEHINGDTFSTIGKMLGIELANGFLQYDGELQRSSPAIQSDLPFQSEALQAYERLSSRISTSTLKLVPGQDFNVLQYQLLQLQKYVSSQIDAVEPPAAS